jgi:hypothetical protein
MKEEIKRHIQRVLKDLPAGFRSERAIGETIKCALFAWIREQGLIPVPSYRPPRRQEEPLPLVALDQERNVIYAFAIAPVITLGAMKTFKIVDAKEKYFITYSQMRKKVEESRFFLTPDVVHLHVGEG